MKIFLIIGFLGQAMFSMRFLVQWIASEKEKRSVVPNSFWVFSIIGSALLLVYAIYKKDPVFILGQTPNLFVYSRNLYFIYKNSKEKRLEKDVIREKEL